MTILAVTLTSLRWTLFQRTRIQLRNSVRQGRRRDEACSSMSPFFSPDELDHCVRHRASPETRDNSMRAVRARLGHGLGAWRTSGGARLPRRRSPPAHCDSGCPPAARRPRPAPAGGPAPPPGWRRRGPVGGRSICSSSISTRTWSGWVSPTVISGSFWPGAGPAANAPARAFTASTSAKVGAVTIGRFSVTRAAARAASAACASLRLSPRLVRRRAHRLSGRARGRPP